MDRRMVEEVVFMNISLKSKEYFKAHLFAWGLGLNTCYFCSNSFVILCFQVCYWKTASWLPILLETYIKP